MEWATFRMNNIHAFKIGLNSSDHKKKKVLMLSSDNKPLLWFDSQTEAAKATEINFRNISACCLGKRKTTGGYKWQYYYGD